VLAGPTLFGIPTALTESLAGIAVGAVVGAGLAIVARPRSGMCETKC
jgi:gas vesicle protein